MANPGFSFGAPPASSISTGGAPSVGVAAPTGGFNFGGTPAATSGAPILGFGATAAPSAPSTTTGFGGFSQPAAAASTGFGFGTPTTATGTTPSAGFKGFPGQGGTPAASAPPSFSLGGTNAATTTTGGNTLLSGLLGAPKTTATPVLSTQATPGFTLGGVAPIATTASAFTGFKMGGTPASTAASAGGFGFAKPVTVTTAATTTAPPASAAGFGFGTLGASTGATSTAQSTGFLGGTAASSALSTATGTTLTSTVPGTKMTYRQLEDQINKWMSELESQEKIFLQQATQVNAWDRLLVDNGEKITQLNGDMERVKVDQSKLDQELEFIKSQQRELEDLILPLEKSLEQLPSSSLQPHADLERENTYQLADNIDAQLKRMVQDLKEIIDHLNMSSSTQDTNDPILQITSILNAHMDSLQWIDNNTALLGRRVEDVSKQMENQKKDQERNFKLVYD